MVFIDTTEQLTCMYAAPVTGFSWLPFQLRLGHGASLGERAQRRGSEGSSSRGSSAKKSNELVT